MKQSYLIMIGILVIGFLLAPTAFKLLYEKSKDFLDDLSDFLSKDGTNQIGIGATVIYEDGTQEVIDGEDFKGLVSLTVYFQDKVIRYIQFDLYGSFTYEGTIETLYRKATIEFDFNKDGTPEDSKTEDANLDPSLIPNSGNSFRLVYVQVTATELENWAGSSGQYSSTVRGRAFITLTFDDGRTSQLESDQDATATFTFEVSVSGATSGLSLSITPRPVAPVPPKV